MLFFFVKRHKIFTRVKIYNDVFLKKYTPDRHDYVASSSLVKKKKIVASSSRVSGPLFIMIIMVSSTYVT